MHLSSYTPTCDAIETNVAAVPTPPGRALMAEACAEKPDASCCRAGYKRDPSRIVTGGKGQTPSSLVSRSTPELTFPRLQNCLPRISRKGPLNNVHECVVGSEKKTPLLIFLKSNSFF